jgi:hypothetical protein
MGRIGRIAVMKIAAAFFLVSAIGTGPATRLGAAGQWAAT